jgi:activator of HSP90 ATPase
MINIKVKKPFQPNTIVDAIFLNKLEVTTITQKVIIPKASPKQVYEAYVDPKIHSEFTDSKVTGKPVIGGKFTAWDGYISGKFLELEEGKKVVQEWSSTDFPEGASPSRLELTFFAVPKGTEIVMVHSNVPKDQEAETAEGWIEFYWEPLKEYFKKTQ